ncbi:MAG: membrane protein insertion efficiency factor YidD [Candidatus Omnitrophica bacterium]|nr:membrane protein insertion efficiency factor YidD [Candidatus Omnitrophota bacterium]
MRRIFVSLIEGYQHLIGAYLPHQCLFVPTCSEYTKQAILEYGSFLGIIKGLKRICMCQSFFSLKFNKFTKESLK